MTLENVRITGKPLILATGGEVDAVEAELWLTLPKGYREYVTTLGEGTLSGGRVRIYPPWRISKELGGWRRRIARYWFWEKSRAALPRERALECVIVGDTTEGDELIVHPSRPDTLFVLPRESDKARAITGDLWTAIDALCAKGAERDFAPFDSREKRQKKSDEVTDPDGESGEALAERAKDWAKRHGMRKEAQHDLREMLADDETKGVTKKQSAEQKVTLSYEALVIDGDETAGSYVAVFEIADKKTGGNIGRFTWSKSEGSSGGTYEPNFTNIARLFKKAK